MGGVSSGRQKVHLPTPPHDDDYKKIPIIMILLIIMIIIMITIMIKAFIKAYWAARASPKSSFSTGFIRVCDLARCHVSFIYKPHAFLIILEPNLRFGLGNHQNSSGFIRYFDQLFLMLQNTLGPMLF